MTQRIHQLERRTVLKASAGLFTAGAGLAAYSQRSRAAVTMGELAVPDGRYESQDGQPYEVFLRVAGEWSYDIAETPDEWRIYLIVHDGNSTRTTLDTATGSLAATTDSGTYEVVGRLTDADFWSRSDFTVDTVGGSKTVDVPVLVLLHVRQGSTILQKAEVTATPTLTIHHAEPPAVLGGEGAFGYQGDEGDPTPTWSG